MYYLHVCSEQTDHVRILAIGNFTFSTLDFCFGVHFFFNITGPLTENIGSFIAVFLNDLVTLCLWLLNCTCFFVGVMFRGPWCSEYSTSIYTSHCSLVHGAQRLLRGKLLLVQHPQCLLLILCHFPGQAACVGPD